MNSFQKAIAKAEIWRPLVCSVCVCVHVLTCASVALPCVQYKTPPCKFSFTLPKCLRTFQMD